MLDTQPEKYQEMILNKGQKSIVFTAKEKNLYYSQLKRIEDDMNEVNTNYISDSESDNDSNPDKTNIDKGKVVKFKEEEESKVKVKEIEINKAHLGTRK
jgi:hypothetical protein